MNTAMLSSGLNIFDFFLPLVGWFISFVAAVVVVVVVVVF